MHKGIHRDTFVGGERKHFVDVHDSVHGFDLLEVDVAVQVDVLVDHFVIVVLAVLAHAAHDG